MSKIKKVSFVGMGLLATSAVTLMIPSTPLGTDVWKIIPFYLFVITSLTAPFVLKRAKKFGDTITGYAYYLSWIPFVLCLFYIVTLFIYR